MLALVFSAAVLISAAGCKSNCRQLSEKACDCTSSSTERTSCLQIAANKETASGVIITAEDDDRCKALLDQCDCRLIDTPAGKERCGFAVSSDAGQ
ncbi:MAG: hypothetical protein JNM17_30140 [Archangium sp.]|nr:hypothetical protein [Archangium sp.]